MSLSDAEWTAVLAELQALKHGVVQRVDLVAEDEVSLEIRRPGRSDHLVLSAYPGLARIHRVEARPQKTLEGGTLQQRLRKQLGGPLLGLWKEGDKLIVNTAKGSLSVRLGGGRGALWLGPSLAMPPEPEADPSQAAQPCVLGDFPMSSALALRYQAKGSTARAEHQAALRLKTLGLQLKKQKRLAANLEGDLRRLAAMKTAGQTAELLKAALHQLKRGQIEAMVMDWSQGREVQVKLDPRLSPKANMEKGFQEAKKAERGQPIVNARLQAVKSAISGLEQQMAAIRANPELALSSPKAPKTQPSGSAAAKAPKTSALDRVARRFVAEDQSEIRVGKGAKENDQLSFRFAKGQDLWFHARGLTGSHVLLRVQSGRRPSPGALLDAAHLAIHYSKAAKAAKAEVMMAEARHVKKVKGAPPGQVGVSRSKTLLIEVEPARLKRLLGKPE